MAKTAKDIMNLIREQGVEMVDFKIVDIQGQFRHVTIPAAHFDDVDLGPFDGGICDYVAHADLYAE